MKEGILKPSKVNRRNFVQWASLGAVATVLFGRSMSAQAADPVKDSDPMAKGLKYCEDAAAAGCATKDKGKDGVCSKCVHYNKDGKSESKVGGKTFGSCTMIQGKLVAAAGTCSMFAKK